MADVLPAEDLDRILSALYQDYRRLPNEDEVGRLAADIQNQAFPELAIPLQLIHISSRRRSFRQMSCDGGGLIIADRAQTVLLSIEDVLVLKREASVAQAIMVMQVPFAEAFRRHGQFARSLICAVQCIEAKSLLAALAQYAACQPGRSMFDLFLMLHEIAHFAVDTQQPFADPVRQLVGDSLEKHCAANLRASAALERGGALPEGIDSSIGDEPDDVRQRMIRQMREHVALVRGHKEVIREACCDFLAVLGFLRWRSGVDVLGSPSPVVEHMTLPEVGDVAMLGLRVSRLLVAQKFLEQTVLHLSQGTDPSYLIGPFSQATARQNIITNLILGLFEGIVEDWTFRNTTSERDELHALHVDRFRQGVRFFNDRSAHLIFEAIEKIGLFHRDETWYEAQLNRIRAELFEGRAPRPDELKTSLDQYIAKLPF